MRRESPGCNGSRGNFVTISHGSHYSRYLHLSSIAKASGSVSAGQLIGYSGSSGTSAAHLHYDELTNPTYGTGKMDPGTLYACHGATRVAYRNWPALEGKTLRNDGYGCLTASNNPVGHYDSAAGGPGTVRVRGWAYDPNAKTTPINIHVYVGGKAGQSGAEGHNIGKADKSRPDVGNAHPGVGNNHGFDATIETGKRGSQPVCVYAINTGPGENVLLGCKTVGVSDPDPRGHLESASSPEGGTVDVSGWTFDPNAPTTALDVHVYIGGRAGAGGENLGSRKADKHRPDVNRIHAGVGDYHGYDETFSTTRRGAQELCVYAINIGPGRNKLLGCQTVTVDDPPPPPPEPPESPQRPESPGAPGPPDVPQDSSSPVVSGVQVTSRFRRARADTPGAVIAARRGAAIRFSLSEPALARFEFRRETRRVRVLRGGRERCVTSLRRTRREAREDFRGSRAGRCSSVYRSVRMAFSRHGGAGANAFRFTGRVGSKQLRTGRYRLYVRATDGAGNTGAYAHSRVFRVVKQ